VAAVVGSTSGALVAILLMFGPISGAQQNPAVAVVMAITSDLTKRVTASYIVVQLHGSCRDCHDLRLTGSASGIATVADIPGRRFPSGFGTSIRIAIVRDDGSLPTALITASTLFSGSATNVADHLASGVTRTASRSNTCATSHSVDRSPTRNSVFDGYRELAHGDGEIIPRASWCTARGALPTGVVSLRIVAARQRSV
jgi:hypothetical protein